jgi:quercetin dioxygenase-like cupin family protein
LARVDLIDGIAPEAGSSLAMTRLQVDPGETVTVGDPAADLLLFVFHGTGTVDADAIAEGTAGLVPAGETATLAAAHGGLSVAVFAVGTDTDLHAPMGPPERIVTTDQVEAGRATGSRTFQVLFGPHNGSTRATLFVGYIPPGKAPWHYHLYDEIVWVWHGSGCLCLGDSAEELSRGAAFRLTPGEIHIVENLAADRELVVLGLFTPAGSPSAAYLMPTVAAAYDIGPA